MSDESPTPIPTAVSDSSPTAPVPDAPIAQEPATVTFGAAADTPATPPEAPLGDAPPVQPDPAPAPVAPEPQAAPVPAPVEPPPPAESIAATAGAEVPPESVAAPPEAVAPETPAPIPVVESVPATGSEVVSPVVDTPAAALATLGPGAGVPEGTTDVLTPVSSMAPPMVQHPILGEIEHPSETVQRLRRKLAEYGDECLKAVQAELEHLQKIFEE